MPTCKPLTDLATFGELQAHARTLKSTSIESLFAQAPERAGRYAAEAAGLRLDYSKHLLDEKGRDILLRLAAEADLPGRAAALLAGEKLNHTEDRPALHSLLRASRAPGLESPLAAVAETRGRMQQWADTLNRGDLRGFTGEPITDVVNIGIGGSDLGPRLVTGALRAFHGPVACHYVANVDPADLQDVLLELEPATTLFIICSKSFRTEETLTNGLTARNWLLHAGAGSGDLDRHFLAITTNLEAAAEFGIPAAQCLPLWDWVGGRYSVWSAVGLSCAVALGWEHFTDFLAGAEAMDTHFASAPVADNLPMLMSLLEIWCCNGLGAGNHVVLPYDQGLARLPDFLQQLTMESNGKRISAAGDPLAYDTAPILWGSAGTMGQHSFHQLLHQGTRLCPADIILPLSTHTGMPEQHARLVANALAQSRALLVGRSMKAARESLLQRGMDDAEADRLAPHLAMPGNRPHSVLSFEAVTPYSLGAVLALYEHRTFCSGQLWGINSFDQWGVELGKEIGASIFSCMAGKSNDDDLDPATKQLLAAWRAAQ